MPYQHTTHARYILIQQRVQHIAQVVVQCQGETQPTWGRLSVFWWRAHGSEYTRTVMLMNSSLMKPLTAVAPVTTCWCEGATDGSHSTASRERDHKACET